MGFRVDRLGGPGPSLEFVRRGPVGRAGVSPLLFVHGASAGAWCWEERFLGFFAETGRQGAAVSLRGHGESEGRGGLAGATLDDFVDDLTRAVAAMPAPPVVVGHSFGGYLAQLLVGRVPVRGLVLMNSLPPEGLALVAAQLACFDPLLWVDAVLGSATMAPALLRGLSLDRIFDGVGEADRRRFGRQLIGESPLALAQAHFPRWVTPAATRSVPTLVLHGARDWLIWQATSARTAAYHGADLIELRESGHFPMLDRSAPDAASRIRTWLDRAGI